MPTPTMSSKRPYVCALVQGSEHGRYLRSLGSAFAADVDLCARLDAVANACEL